jgi:hypothetical protein
MNQLEIFRNSYANQIFKAIKPKNLFKMHMGYYTSLPKTGKNCKNSYGCEGLAGWLLKC